ncbi:outer membrane protein [Parvibaculum sp.]|uniref:outer membrane protein n=1 Tax=Parvibaculum sp. TaxID=2024848 RepID=UPI003210D119
MRKLLVAMGLMGSLVMAAPAHAAELGQISGPGATFMWGGFYVGVNGGYAWGDHEWPEFDKSYSADGALAGVTGGFNIDSGDWIFGFEMDYDWTDMGGDQTGYPYYRSARHVSTDLKTLGTARVRAGYDVGEATNPLLLYVTGGLAFGNVEATLQEVSCGDGCQTSSSTDKHVRFGWTLGAGAEYAFDQNWSAKLEYLHVDLGEDRYTFHGAIFGNGSTNIKIDGIDLVRVGVNYLF